jgi:glycosyltransferase involved in cell wall biosynthesis
MPTANRRQFVPSAIRYFQAQTYPSRELVILDDGAESVADLIPDDPTIRYTRLTGRRTLGAKRNESVEASRGDLIMHWDDDDWVAPRRIAYQVEVLLREEAEVCGTRQLLYFEPATGQTWLYEYPANQRRWLIGGTLLYKREFWRRSPFPSIDVGEDSSFVLNQQLERAVVLTDYDFYVAMVHPGNTSQKIHAGPYWSRWDGDLAAIMGEELDAYRQRHGMIPLVLGPVTSLDGSAASGRPRPTGDQRMKLNLGCCDAPLPDYVNVDVVPEPGKEAIDLRKTWPWAESAVDHVRALDLVEHLPDKVFTMNELWRVLKPGATVEIAVPTTDGTGAFQDPTHVSFWNRRSFLYYEVNNPYRERFAEKYGILAKFRTLREQTEPTVDGPRLTILLEAVKP